MFSQGDEHKGI
jgi:hypothetical protein